MNFRQITPFIILITLIAVMLQVGCDKLVTEKETIYVNDPTLGVGCFDCHTQDDNLLIRPKNQFENSAHADYSYLGSVEDGTDCRKCHTHQGFLVAYDSVQISPTRYAGLNCFTCHLPHPEDAADYGTWSIHDLRAADNTTLFAGLVDTGRGTDFKNSNLCVNCHTNKNSVPVGANITLTDDFGPHYSPQGDIMSGKSSYFIKPKQHVITAHADTSISSRSNAGGCIKCHYGTTDVASGMGNGYDFAEHTFRLYDEETSTEYYNTCNVSGCHVTDPEPIVSFFDNDSVRAIDNLASTVASHLIAFDIIDPSDSSFTVGDTISQLKAQALFNYLMYKNDNSRGIHNLHFVTKFLDSTAQILDSLPPIVDFVTNDTNACLTEGIIFTPNIIGEFDSINWDFGDNHSTYTTSGGPITHTYDTVGIYTVSMKAVSHWERDRYNPADSITTISDTITTAFYSSDTLLYIDAPPVADVHLLNGDTLNTFCRGDEVFFVNNSSNIIPGTYTWDFGYGDSIVGTRDLSHVYDTIGDFTVSMTVETECGDSTKILDSLVRIEGAMPYLSAIDTKVCLDSTVFFVNNSIDNIDAVHVLNYGQGTATILKGDTVPVVYNLAATYNVNFTITTACGVETLNLPAYITVGDATVGFVTLDSTVCLGDTIFFVNNSVHNIATEHAWDFGNGETLIDTFAGGANGDIAKLYDSIGIYDVSLTLSPDTAYGCPVVSLVEPSFITIKGAMLDFEANDSTICKGETAIFINNSVDNLEGTYTWNFGDGSSTVTDSSTTINHVYATAGTYDVSLEFASSDTFNCVTPILVKQAFIAVGEVSVGFEAVNSTVCLGDTVFFTNNSAHNIDAVHTWSFGNGDTIVTPIVAGGNGDTVYVYDSIGTYDVSLTISLDTTYGCPVVDSVIPNYITIEGAMINFDVVDDSVCHNDTTFFINNSVENIPGTYTWDFGDGSAPVEDNSGTVMYVYPAGGTYDVKLSFASDAPNTCVTDSLRKTSFVKVIEVDVDFEATTSTNCIGDTVIFINKSVTSILGDYEWDFGNGVTLPDNADTIRYVYDTVGRFDVSLTFTSSDITSCGTASNTKTGFMTIEGAMIDGDVVDSIVCLGDTITFINNSYDSTLSGGTYSWDFGDDSTYANAPDTVKHVYQEGKTFDAILSFIGTCGTNSVVDTVTVTIADDTLIVSVANSTTCIGYDVIFANNSIFNSEVIFTWNFGNGDSKADTVNGGVASNEFYAYDSIGTFDVSVSLSSICGVELMNNFATITVDGAIPSFTESTSDSLTYTFTNTSQGTIDSLKWDFEGNGTYNTSTTSPIDYTYTTGIYNATLIVYNANCSIIDSVITVITVP